MLLVTIRTVILFVMVLISLRVMGKRQIGQLQPFELVIVILLAELAALPMANSGVPLVNGILPILILVLAQVLLSYISLKSLWARGVICGTPSIVIKNGTIVEEELRNSRYNINDLLEQLRAKDIFNIADVEFAILETSGELNVIPKSQKRPLTPGDIGIDTDYEGLSTALVIDGQVIKRNLTRNNLSIEWLQNEIAKYNYHDFKELLLVSLDTNGNLYIQTKQATR